MRSLWVVGVVVGCLAQVWADGTPPPNRTKVLPAAMLRHLQQGLSPAARQRLAGTITPRQQLSVLQSDPAMRQKLRGLKLKAPQPLPLDPAWETGITLTPLNPAWGPAANTASSFLCLGTEAGYLSRSNPLPAAGQNPPLLWLRAPSSSPLLRIEAQWPIRGAYMITFFMQDIWPNSPYKPRVWQQDTPLTVYGNAPTGADQWTILWLAPDPQQLYHEVRVYPSEQPYGFMACCISKVVVSRVWLE
jgi:hypothetical protein